MTHLEELHEMICRRNRNRAKAEEYLKPLGMHFCGYDMEAKKVVIFQGDYPHSDFAGYINKEYDINSIEWGKGVLNNETELLRISR